MSDLLDKGWRMDIIYNDGFTRIIKSVWPLEAEDINNQGTQFHLYRCINYDQALGSYQQSFTAVLAQGNILQSSALFHTA